jgi:hypothetical protein
MFHAGQKNPGVFRHSADIKRKRFCHIERYLSNRLPQRKKSSENPMEDSNF